MKLALALVAAGALVWAADEPVLDDGSVDSGVTFRSDVSLVRVDVQVLESGGAVTGLTVDDFELRDNGKIVPIRNFAREELPMDVMFLLDVSGSMQPHISSVARASRQALNVMGQDDRVAVMVFDRNTRLRAPFRPAGDAYRDLERVIDQESFNGGTDVTGALKDAIRYVAKQGRREGRRAIIIVTDDMTEFQADVAGIGRMLAQNDIVLSALIAPDAMGNRTVIGGGGGRRGGGRTGGSTWPNGGGWPGSGLPFPIPGGSGGGRRLPGGVVIGGNGGPTMAGSPQIARESGGDSFDVDEARALEQTLERLRQRYALFFHAPAGSREGQERMLEVRLVGNAARRHSYADLRYRDSYIATDVVDDGSDVGTDAPTVSANTGGASRSGADDADTSSDRPRLRRRPAVSEPGSTSGPNPNLGGWRQADPVDEPAAAPAVVTAPAAQDTPKTGGWRKATPQDVE